MSRKKLVLVLLVVVVIGGFLYDRITWRTTRSEKYNFTVKMPGVSALSQDHPGSAHFSVHLSRGDGFISYGVDCIDKAQDTGSSSEGSSFYDDRLAELKRWDSQVKTEQVNCRKEADGSTVPGVTYYFKKSPTESQERIFLVGARRYVLHVYAPKGKMPTFGAKRFFNSFKLIR